MSGRSISATPRSATPRSATYVSKVPVYQWPTGQIRSDQQAVRDRIASESARRKEQNEREKKKKTHKMHFEIIERGYELSNQGDKRTKNGIEIRKGFENTEEENAFKAKSKAIAEAYAEEQGYAYHRELDEVQKVRSNLPRVTTTTKGGYMNITKRRLLVGIINSKKKNSGKKTKVLKRKVKAVKAVKAVSVLKPVRRRKPTIVRK